MSDDLFGQLEVLPEIVGASKGKGKTERAACELPTPEPYLCSLREYLTHMAYRAKLTEPEKLANGVVITPLDADALYFHVMSAAPTPEQLFTTRVISPEDKANPEKPRHVTETDIVMALPNVQDANPENIPVRSIADGHVFIPERPITDGQGNVIGKTNKFSLNAGLRVSVTKKRIVPFTGS